MVKINRNRLCAISVHRIQYMPANIGEMAVNKMRYRTLRKYPITQMKKNNQMKEQDHFVDISLGAAAGLLALVFAEGLIWGYMIKKLRK